MFRLKRVYEAAEASDGTRVLVDRLWPRGVSKADARIDLWLKDVAPSVELRKWFGHDPARYEEFRARYLVELQGGAAAGAVEQLREMGRHGVVTLIVATRDAGRSSGALLLELLRP